MKTQTPKRFRRGIYLLPNLFTLAAMYAGFFAIVMATAGHFERASIAILIAILLDGLDGRVARMTHTQSDFGAQLDSLSDMVSFGIAPACHHVLSNCKSNSWFPSSRCLSQSVVI